MTIIKMAVLLAATAILTACTAHAEWQEEFDLSSCNLVTTGQNQYFVMQPGFRLTLEGGNEKLNITVLDETREVDGVVTRVVEEREWKDGNLYEVSRNYFAICEESNDVYYFGEEVDFYEDGKVVKHDGAWLAGENGNRAGLIMPGTPKLAMKYYQEIAPGVAMDRAEIVSLDETCKTPAGTFAKCLRTKEGTALNPFETEYKYYAPGIGLIQDQDMRLTKYGAIEN